MSTVEPRDMLRMLVLDRAAVTTAGTLSGRRWMGQALDLGRGRGCLGPGGLADGVWISYAHKKLLAIKLHELCALITPEPVPRAAIAARRRSTGSLW